MSRISSNLENINYGNSSSGSFDTMWDGVNPLKNICSEKPTPLPITEEIVLPNLITPPDNPNNKLYQYEGELYFSGKTVDKTFTFDQATPETIWTIAHNLNKLPSVTIVDSSGRIVYGGSVSYLNVNTLTIEFGSAFSGKAYVN